MTGICGEKSMASYLDRTISLIGKKSLENIQSKTILVVGLGGVGGTTLEALARSGFKHFIIVDFDKVDVTNLNRQIMYLEGDDGKSKVDICINRLKAINKDIDVKGLNVLIDEKTVSLLEKENIDFIVDAIDKVEGKLALYQFAESHNVPVISSMGMGKRIDPSKVFVTNLNKTEGDPLARKIRYECKQRGIAPSKIKVVCSKEEPVQSGVTIASMMMVPSTAGLIIAKEIINHFLLSD